MRAAADTGTGTGTGTTAPAAPAEPVRVTAIPYYAWANREAGAMRVWLPV
ncbi:hypothetical protein ABZ553_38080 [Streptomyces sparsogenes]